MKNLERYGPPIFLVLVSLGIAGFFGYVATTRKLTNLEGFIWQFLSLFIGLIGSFLFGRQSAKEAAREIIRPHARSAFRRLLSLYGGISQVARILDSSEQAESLDDYKLLLARLEGNVFWQLATADNALEDWRDIVPEDIDELYQEISDDNRTEDRQ